MALSIVVIEVIEQRLHGDAVAARHHKRAQGSAPSGVLSLPAAPCRLDEVLVKAAGWRMVIDGIERTLLNNAGGAAEPRLPAAVTDSFSHAPLAPAAPPPRHRGLQQSLALAKSDVYDLRLQLNHLRQLQVLRAAGTTGTVLDGLGLVSS
ncbi:hypothetical protein EYF80_068186 [Liparis tanakae]|uniref:Uncharacterized protein n=1 Tax=Liparis tanakae TaxID=230148 RepID=A0A4Z2DZX6_9TELE|nr:hypothetical protein EYF80_068186 [Liparis tanakae]